MGWGTAEKGCPTTNAAERALLEGFRMGVITAQEGSTHGKGAGKAASKGTGKGSAAGKASGARKIEDRTCQREGARAAVQQQATWGGGRACHCCGLSLTATLPVEQLVGWAFQRRLDAKASALTKSKARADGAAPPRHHQRHQRRQRDRSPTPSSAPRNWQPRGPRGWLH